ncbi:MAG: hypothetical protein AB8G99_24640 [Planctomycetaceae bacterium]
MNSFPLRCLAMCLFVLVSVQCALMAVGQDGIDQESVRIDTAWSAASANAGDQLVLAIVMEVADGYYIGNSAERIDKDDRGQVMPTEVTLKPLGDQSSRVKVGQADSPAGTVKASNKTPPLEASRSRLIGRAIVYVPVDVGDVSGKSLQFALSVTTQA